MQHNGTVICVVLLPQIFSGFKKWKSAEIVRLYLGKECKSASLALIFESWIDSKRTYLLSTTINRLRLRVSHEIWLVRLK